MLWLAGVEDAALCRGSLGSGCRSTEGCSVLGAQFASVLWVIVTQNNLTQILLPLHAVTRILLLKLL